MTSRVAFLSLLVSVLAPAVHSAEEAPRTNMKDVLKARIAEDAKKAEAKKSAPTPSSESAKADSTESPGKDEKTEPVATKPATATKPASTAKSQSPARKESPTVLPKVEVKKGRITELDQKLAKQEQDIARERKNLKVSEVDSALNDSKVASPLSIFGGESSQFRQRVASERVELMEAEKDLIEAIARAKTKEEKKELQKQLDELKMVRRELDKSLR
jgi:hypothetical protein